MGGRSEESGRDGSGGLSPVFVRRASQSSGVESTGGSALDCKRQLRPRRGATRPRRATRTVFRRALEHENLLVAEATAREIGHVCLFEALELTALIARKAPRRHPRVAARWLLRYLEEHRAATIAEAGVVAACLAALGTPGHDDAVATLQALARAQ